MSLDLPTIAAQFAGSQAVSGIAPLGNGLINATYRVETSTQSFVLQGINGQVFSEPERVMANLQILAEHVQRLPQTAVRLQIPAWLPACDGRSFFRDPNDQYWRALQLIEPAESRERLTGLNEAEQVGFALGHFHRLCSDLPIGVLYDTLPGFHITPDYFHDYRTLLENAPAVEAAERFQYCEQFIERFRDKIAVLEQAKARGELKERVIHGDPKLNNFLFLPASCRIVSLIDLDTVKPGLVHYDIGDCLRSCCQNAEQRFDLEICRAILAGYLQEAGHFFGPADYDYLYAAIELIPFELGLRFFSDYLAGNRYFKVGDQEENLRRAIGQFRLCEDIAAQRIAIENIIADLRRHSSDY